MYFAIRKRLLRSPALRLLGSFLLLLTFSAPTGAMGAGAVTEFPVPTPNSGPVSPVPTANSGPVSITAGSDGNIWFVEDNGNKIGRITPAGVITEFLPVLPDSQLWGITAGPDGNLLFIEFNGEDFGGRIDVMSTAGAIITGFSIGIPQGFPPSAVTVGPDGNLWYTKPQISVGDKIGTTAGTGAHGLPLEFPIPTANSEPQGITAGLDGNLWFTEFTGNKIGQITPAGVITEFSVPTANSGPLEITAGPDGNLWFTEFNANQIGQITPAGVITEFPVLTAASGPNTITAGRDGNLWFTEFNANQIGRITPAGVITEFALPTPNSGPLGITAGPDGNLWFTEVNANQIGRISAMGVTLVVTGDPRSGPYAVEAQTTLPGALAVNFFVDGTFFHQESVYEYCLFGGDAACATGTLGAGAHTINAQVMAQGTSTVLAEAQIKVTERPSGTVTLVVTGTPGSGPYAVEAQTTLPGALTVNFFVDGTFFHQESVYEYCLFGGDAACATGTLGAGAHTIKAQVMTQGTTTVLAESQVTVTE